MIKVDPKTYGLPPQTVLMKDNNDNFTLVINRKSRIIMKDASAILEKAVKIKDSTPGATITLKTTAPVCSKSTRFLSDNGIDVISGE